MRTSSRNYSARGSANLLLWVCVCLLGSGSACAGGEAAGDDVIASFEGVDLLREEVDLFTPDGISPEDSITYANQYVEQWMALQAMAAEATTEVSEREARFRYQMARYRDQLITQLFTEKLVEERPEMLEVSPSDIEGYYSRNRNNFISSTDWFQFFYVKTPLSGQYQVVNQMQSRNESDLDQLRSWARDNAVSWKLDSTWQPATEFLKLREGFYFGDIARVPLNTVYPYSHNEGDTRYYDFLRILQVVREGEVLPLSLCQEQIVQIIRNERKNALIEETKNILLKQAQQSGKMKDYREP